MNEFEDKLHDDLHQFLLSMKEVDERLPECPDVEEKWESIAKAYIPDGIREFQDFPSASLGFQRLRILSASALPDGSSHAAEAYGLSHDENVITD